MNNGQDIRLHEIHDAVKRIEEKLDASVEAAVAAEREAISAEARRYAGHYLPGSDGRNTFVMLADWIDGRAVLIAGATVSEGRMK